MLLVDYDLDISVLRRLRWRHGMILWVRGELSGWDEMNLLRGELSGGDEMNLLRGELGGWGEVNLHRGELSGWDEVDLHRGELNGWDEADLLRGVLSGCVEINFDDDVEERTGRCLRKSGQSVGDSGRSQMNDRNQSNNHCPVDDRHQMNHHHSRMIVVFWVDPESKNENNRVLNHKGRARIVDHDLVSMHREYHHAYLKKPHKILDRAR